MYFMRKYKIHIEKVEANTIAYEYGNIKLKIEGSNITLKINKIHRDVLIGFDKNSLEHK